MNNHKEDNGGNKSNSKNIIKRKLWTVQLEQNFGYFMLNGESIIL